jgi:hypothetical protein
MSHNFSYVSFSVSVCPSVLTMSFPAPCADSACPPGMLICHAVLLSLLKKSGKVFVTLVPRFPPPWPARLCCLVFDAIKIATSLVVCFLQRQFHHRWQNHGTVFLTKIEPKRARSSTSVLTPAVPHQIQAIILKNCSSSKEPFEPLLTWSSKLMVMVDNDGSLSGDGLSLTLTF